mmetsp:Transcript_11909/g.35503  ORF Transcript_11909/g.35503 Transcript_11909/m.35503 type:complete len:253 (+) Transcript_11909:38-796(+)
MYFHGASVVASSTRVFWVCSAEPVLVGGAPLHHALVALDRARRLGALPLEALDLGVDLGALLDAERPLVAGARVEAPPVDGVAELGHAPELVVEALEPARLGVPQVRVGEGHLLEGADHEREDLVGLGEEGRDEVHDRAAVEDALELGDGPVEDAPEAFAPLRLVRGDVGGGVGRDRERRRAAGAGPGRQHEGRGEEEHATSGFHREKKVSNQPNSWPKLVEIQPKLGPRASFLSRPERRNGPWPGKTVKRT